MRVVIFIMYIFFQHLLGINIGLVIKFVPEYLPIIYFT